jgi:hypothetical protein
VVDVVVLDAVAEVDLAVIGAIVRDLSPSTMARLGSAILAVGTGLFLIPRSASSVVILV